MNYHCRKEVLLMKRIVALLGDHWHDFLTFKQGLEAAITTLSDHGDIEIKYIDYKNLKLELSYNPDAFIISKENRINPLEINIHTWLSDDIGDAITEYVNNGGGCLAWHSGMAQYPTESAYVKMLKGYFKYHPTDHKPVMYKIVPASTEGESNFRLLDEHYFVYCDESNTEVFLRSESVDGASIAGWSHPYGKGRVCCFTPAHRPDVSHDKSFSQLLGKTVSWVSSKK
jgi:type 1 glutamine amidotransferase